MKVKCIAATLVGFGELAASSFLRSALLIFGSIAISGTKLLSAVFLRYLLYAKHPRRDGQVWQWQHLLPAQRPYLLFMDRTRSRDPDGWIQHLRDVRERQGQRHSFCAPWSWTV